MFTEAWFTIYANCTILKIDVAEWQMDDMVKCEIGFYHTDEDIFTDWITLKMSYQGIDADETVPDNIFQCDGDWCDVAIATNDTLEAANKVQCSCLSCSDGFSSTIEDRDAYNIYEDTAFEVSNCMIDTGKSKIGFFNKLANDTVATFNMNFQKSFITEDQEEDIIMLPETFVKAKVRVTYMDVNNEPNANITLAEDVFDL